MALRLELLNKNPTDFTPFGTKPAGIIMKDNTVQSYSVTTALKVMKMILRSLMKE